MIIAESVGDALSFPFACEHQTLQQRQVSREFQRQWLRVYCCLHHLMIGHYELLMNMSKLRIDDTDGPAVQCLNVFPRSISHTITWHQSLVTPTRDVQIFKV